MQTKVDEHERQLSSRLNGRGVLRERDDSMNT